MRICLLQNSKCIYIHVKQRKHTFNMNITLIIYFLHFFHVNRNIFYRFPCWLVTCAFTVNVVFVRHDGGWMKLFVHVWTYIPFHWIGMYVTKEYLSAMLAYTVYRFLATRTFLIITSQVRSDYHPLPRIRSHHVYVKEKQHCLQYNVSLEWYGRGRERC